MDAELKNGDDITNDDPFKEDAGFVIVEKDKMNSFLNSETMETTNNSNHSFKTHDNQNDSPEPKEEETPLNDDTTEPEQSIDEIKDLQLKQGKEATNRSAAQIEDSPLQQKLVWLETCVQCDMRVEDQRTLKCNHSFCINCISELAEQKSVRCFNCSEVTELPSEGVRGLQPNIPVLMFQKLVARMKEKHEDPLNQTCGFCKIAETVFYCSQCDKNMCEECKIKHGRPPLFAQHDVRAVSDLKEGLLRKQVAKCKNHPSEEVKYMCTECYELLCSVCVQFAACGDHDKKIQPINQLLKGNRKDARLQSIQIKQNVEALKKYYNSAIQSQEEVHLAQIDIENHHQKVIDDVMRKIEEKKTELIAQLDRTKEKMQSNQVELEKQWQKFERRASQVEQWEKDMDDNMSDDLISAITITNLQYRFQSVEFHIKSVQRKFNNLKPIKVNFQPKEGEQVGIIKVEVEQSDCILPVPSGPEIQMEKNPLYVVADSAQKPIVMQQNPLYQSGNSVKFEGVAKSPTKRGKPVPVQKPTLKCLPKDSIAGLVDPNLGASNHVDMSARPLTKKPYKLYDPKKISSAVFVDTGVLAVLDSLISTITIYEVARKKCTIKKSRRFKDADCLTALAMHGNHLLAVDNSLTIFKIHPELKSSDKDTTLHGGEHTKVGDITTLSDGCIIISQIAPDPQLLRLDAQFELLDRWNMTSTEVPRFITSDKSDHVIVVDTSQGVVTIYNISDGLALEKELRDYQDPRGLCHVDGITYIVRHDPLSGSDWVDKLGDVTAMTWSKEKINEYGKAITVASSEDYFAIVTEKAIEVFSRADMVIEDEALSD